MFEEEKRIYGHYLEELRGKRGHELSTAATEFVRNGDTLVHRRAEAANAEAVVLDRLGSALDVLELQIAVQIGLGQTIIESALPKASGEDEDGSGVIEVEDPLVWRVVIVSQLWCRAIGVIEDALKLLSAGFSAAALGRWRTLHELDVSAFAIARSSSTSTLYGFSKYESRSLTRLLGDHDTLQSEFPRDSMLIGDYGWARDFVESADATRSARYKGPDDTPSFADVQRAVGISRRELELYRAANGILHGGQLVELLGSRTDWFAQDPEEAMIIGATSAMSGIARTFRGFTGTLMLVAQDTGAEGFEPQFEVCELFVSDLHALLGLEEDESRAPWA